MIGRGAAQMPLADYAGDVASVLQGLGYGSLFRWEANRRVLVAMSDRIVFVAEVIGEKDDEVGLFSGMGEAGKSQGNQRVPRREVGTRFMKVTFIKGVRSGFTPRLLQRFRGINPLLRNQFHKIATSLGSVV